MKLYVVTHKESNFLPEGRTFIGVGKDKNINNVNCYDNSGENISEKNPTYCELTALYWIWKNDDSDIIGLEHYRRFFCFKHKVLKMKPISSNKVDKILKNKDVIVPKKYRFIPNVYENYKLTNIIDDYNKCMDVVKELYPEYMDAFNIVNKSKKAYICNMFIMKKKYVDSYSKWLFDILIKVEDRISIEGRDNYQTRVFGFLAERLFNVWLIHNNLKTYELPIYMPSDRPIKVFMKSIIDRLSNIKHKLVK